MEGPYELKTRGAMVSVRGPGVPELFCKHGDLVDSKSLLEALNGAYAEGFKAAAAAQTADNVVALKRKPLPESAVSTDVTPRRLLSEATAVWDEAGEPASALILYTITDANRIATGYLTSQLTNSEAVALCEIGKQFFLNQLGYTLFPEDIGD